MLKSTFKIIASDCSASRHLKLSSFQKMVQQASIQDVINIGITKEKTLDKGLLWVISRMTFKIYRVPCYDEKVTLITFPLRRIHYFFPRYYILKDESGNVLIQGEGIWTLIDENNRRPINPSDHSICIYKSRGGDKLEKEDFSFFLPSFKRADKEIVREVLYSDLDLNGHMTNTRYADWATDLLGDDIFIKAESITFSYLKEGKLGERIIQKIQKDSSDVLIQGIDESSLKSVFEVYLTY